MFRLMRVYANGYHRRHQVETQAEVDKWQEYNARFRPGCACFIEGKCVQTGYLSHDQIVKIEQELSDECQGT